MCAEPDNVPLHVASSDMKPSGETEAVLLLLHDDPITFDVEHVGPFEGVRLPGDE